MAQSLTGSQLARLAAALHFYGRRLSGPTWIAMEVAEPHEVVGFGASLADAKALELFVEKKNTGAGPIVTFALTDPTTVQYHLILSSGSC